MMTEEVKSFAWDTYKEIKNFTSTVSMVMSKFNLKWSKKLDTEIAQYLWKKEAGR